MVSTPSKIQKVLSNTVLQPSDFIIVGEMHGSKQNAPLIQEIAHVLLVKSKSLTIAFEWMLSDMELYGLQKYIHGGTAPAQLPNFFLHSDGRFTYEHVSLLKWIRAHNLAKGNSIDIYVFDKNNGVSEPDQSMAYALRSYKKDHTAALILVETGNMHARNSPYLFAGIKQTPMASVLKKDYSVFSIFLRYLDGEINVNGVSRKVVTAASQIEGPGMYFDAVIDIPVSVASENIENLTRISELFII